MVWRFNLSNLKYPNIYLCSWFHHGGFRIVINLDHPQTASREAFRQHLPTTPSTIALRFDANTVCFSLKNKTFLVVVLNRIILENLQLARFVHHDCSLTESAFKTVLSRIRQWSPVCSDTFSFSMPRMDLPRSEETLNGISFLYFRQRIIANGRQALLFLPIPKNTRCSGRKLILHKKWQAE